MKIKVYENDKKKIQLNSVAYNDFPFVARVPHNHIFLIGLCDDEGAPRSFLGINLKSGNTCKFIPASWVYPVDAEITFK